MADAVREVRNRDIITLQNVYPLMQEIVSVEKRVEYMRDRMNVRSQVFTGMPLSNSLPHGIDATIADVIDAETTYSRMLKRLLKELKRAERIINGIPSESMRVFCVMLYMDGISDNEVRERLNMTRHGFERARSSVENALCMKTVTWRERYILAEEDGHEQVDQA